MRLRAHQPVSEVSPQHDSTLKIRKSGLFTCGGGEGVPFSCMIKRMESSRPQRPREKPPIDKEDLCVVILGQLPVESHCSVSRDDPRAHWSE